MDIACGIPVWYAQRARTVLPGAAGRACRTAAWRRGVAELSRGRVGRLVENLRVVEIDHVKDERGFLVES